MEVSQKSVSLPRPFSFLLEQTGSSGTVGSTFRLHFRGHLVSGTEAALLRCFEQLAQPGVDQVIVDFRRVTALDEPTTRIVDQLVSALKTKGKSIFLSGLNPAMRSWLFELGCLQSQEDGMVAFFPPNF